MSEPTAPPEPATPRPQPAGPQPAQAEPAQAESTRAESTRAESTPPEPARPQSTRTGPGRLLVAVYGLFALSAFARAAVQIATKFGHAPVAYLLSALAAVVYIVATVTLASGSPRARRIALVSCSVELVGVLAVGTWSLADRATFPDATVWSGYGSGYGYVPLVLPVFGLLWLRYWSRRTAAGRDAAGESGQPSR